MLHAGRRGLEERLAAGESILCAEGYVLALTRMGYVAPGVWVPDFLIDRPEVLRNLYCQFADAGSDVIEAYQVSAWHIACWIMNFVLSARAI